MGPDEHLGSTPLPARRKLNGDPERPAVLVAQIFCKLADHRQNQLAGQHNVSPVSVSCDMPTVSSAELKQQVEATEHPQMLPGPLISSYPDSSACRCVAPEKRSGAVPIALDRVGQRALVPSASPSAAFSTVSARISGPSSCTVPQSMTSCRQPSLGRGTTATTWPREPLLPLVSKTRASAKRTSWQRPRGLRSRQRRGWPSGATATRTSGATPRTSPRPPWVKDSAGPQPRRTADSSAARQPSTMPSAALPRIDDRPAEYQA